MSKKSYIFCFLCVWATLAVGCKPVDVDQMASGGFAIEPATETDPFACDVRVTESDVILNGLPLVRTELVTEENYPNMQVTRLAKHLRRFSQWRRGHFVPPADPKEREEQIRTFSEASLTIDGNVPFETVRLVMTTLAASGFSTLKLSRVGSDSPPVVIDQSVRRGRRNVGLADLLSNKLGPSGAISSILADNTDQFENRMAVAMSGTESDLMVGYGANNMGFRGTGSGDGGTGGYGRIHGLGNVDTGGGSGMRAGLGKKGARKVGQMRLFGMQGSGFCNKGNIEAVVKQRAGALRACYEKELQLHAGLSGKVAVRWSINLEGKVESASVTNSTINNPKVESCIMSVIRRMRFQAPEGGICVVQWPFVFSPG